jgi:2-methylcitrate dehydratase PrpD
MRNTTPLLSRRTLIAGGSAASLLYLWPAALQAAERLDGTSAMARRLADYICAVRLRDFALAAIERAKEHLIYHVGLAFSGALTPTGRQAVEIAALLGAAAPQTSTIIGRSEKTGPLAAAFANASFMRALGFDDVHVPSLIHPGLLTYPVALAVAEQRHSSGEELLTAVITGYEVMGKLFLEQDAARAPRRSSMPFGAFGGAAAAARLMKLSPAQTANAIGYAADAAMGLKEGNEQQPTHYYGLVARNAITAAVVAQAGGETSPSILEGKYGFYATLIGRQPEPDAIVALLGKDPEILRATQKRYPGTATNIVAIQLVLDLVDKERLSASNVARIEFQLPNWRATFEDSTSAGPYPSRTQAESSLPFQTAIILLDGRMDFARYDRFNDPAILAVTKRVAIDLIPHRSVRYARVRITTTDGRSFEREGEDYVFPPLDAVEWLAKDGAKFLPLGKLERFAHLVRRLESLADAAELMALLAPSGRELKAVGAQR